MLPDSFVFTQQNLQDYVDCPYRFYLREILKLEWPAVESEPIREQEELMALGTRFHLLCQQYFSGIPADLLAAQITQPDLAVWWSHFLALQLQPVPGSFLVEKLVSLPFAGYRLAAKYDLLINHPDGSIKIYDWKTSQHQPKRQTLLGRMQSQVYPLVASYYNQLKNAPAESIEMIFWYPAFPTTPIKFTYSQSQLQSDQEHIDTIIHEIAGKSENQFIKTREDKKCRFCRYRSLCSRGSTAGILSELEDVTESDDAFLFDFDAA